MHPSTPLRRHQRLRRPQRVDQLPRRLLIASDSGHLHLRWQRGKLCRLLLRRWQVNDDLVVTLLAADAHAVRADLLIADFVLGAALVADEFHRRPLAPFSLRAVAPERRGRVHQKEKPLPGEENGGLGRRAACPDGLHSRSHSSKKLLDATFVKTSATTPRWRTAFEQSSLSAGWPSEARNLRWRENTSAHAPSGDLDLQIETELCAQSGVIGGHAEEQQIAHPSA